MGAAALAQGAATPHPSPPTDRHTSRAFDSRQAAPLKLAPLRSSSSAFARCRTSSTRPALMCCAKIEAASAEVEGFMSSLKADGRGRPHGLLSSWGCERCTGIQHPAHSTPSTQHRAVTSHTQHLPALSLCAHACTAALPSTQHRCVHPTHLPTACLPVPLAAVAMLVLPIPPATQLVMGACVCACALHVLTHACKHASTRGRHPRTRMDACMHARPPHPCASALVPIPFLRVRASSALGQHPRTAATAAAALAGVAESRHAPLP